MIPPWLNGLLDLIANHDGPVMIMLAGPNGAGKSTFHEIYLSSTGLEYFNADEIARERFGRHPVSTEESQEIQNLVTQAVASKLANHESFIRETVFSDKQDFKINELRSARASGYLVILIFIALESWELSSLRVLQRVRSDGHGVEMNKLERRHRDSMVNLGKAQGIPHSTLVLDNSSTDYIHRLTVSDGAITFENFDSAEWLRTGMTNTYL